MQEFMRHIDNTLIQSVPLASAPLPIQNGEGFYIPPNQANFDVLSVVCDVEDPTKTPRVVVAMPYWTRHINPRTGVEEVEFYAGVNVMNLHGGNQNNVLPISRYAPLYPQPQVPQNIVNWIRSR